MTAPYVGTYAVLRDMALRGSLPAQWDCAHVEREARALHRYGYRSHARFALMLARALWSARRAPGHTTPTNQQGTQ